MPVYLVTWDINREKPNYNDARNKLIARMQTLTHKKDPGLDSVWFVQSNEGATTLRDYIRVAMDDNDRIVVSRMNPGQHDGWLNKDVWEWINARL